MATKILFLLFNFSFMKTELLLKLVELIINSDSKSETLEITSELNEQYPIGKKIIIRGYDCGVLFGTLVSVTKWVYRIKDCRRLYYWKAKSGISLEDVANYWITIDSKLTSTVSLCDVTDSRVSLLIPCSKESIKTIESQIDYIP